MKELRWNDAWRFWSDRNSFALVWSIPEHARLVDLPHDAMHEEHPCPQSRNGGNTGYRDGDDYQYVKMLFAPNAWREQTVMLKFEGVYSNALVYLNGALVAKCPYGYSTFYATLNPYLRYGAENEIRVMVKNGSMANSRWYSGSGIYRDVYLLTGGKNHIPPNGLQITAGSDGVAHIRTQVEGTGQVRLAIEDAQGTLVASTIGQDVCVTVPGAQLWSAEQPHLYTCKASLVEHDVVLDTCETSFGFRTLTLDAAHGLRVNGTAVKLRGACIHHDNGPIGAAEYDGAAFRRVRLLKEAGFNAVRMAHHPMSQNLLRACDALGMYVMDEAFDMWTRTKSHHDYALYFLEWWQFDLEAMIKKDYNHPSVVLYSLGNEIPEIATEQGTQLLAQMAQFTRALDATRYLLCGINGVFAAGDGMPIIMADVAASLASSPEQTDGNVNDFMTMMDVHMDQIVTHPVIDRLLERACAPTDVAGYNYMAARYEHDSLVYPNRVMVGSETYPPDIARNWSLVQRLPAVIGDFTWTGWDYIGEAGVGIPAYRFGEGGFGAQYPCQLAYCGDIDITGFRRPLSYLRETVFGLSAAPYISVQNPHHYGEKLIKTPWVMSDSVAAWDWPGCEGRPVCVEVYSSADTVELFQDGVSLGKQSPQHCVAMFETVYRPGTLCAVHETGERCELSTATGQIEIAVTLREEGELLYAQVCLMGENGVVCTGADRGVTLTWEGPAVLLGFAGGNPKPEDYYPDAHATTWYGRALAVLRRTGSEPVRVNVAQSGS